jgi:hypothetical protein
MKKLLLPVFLMLSSVSSLYAQEVLYSEDFEDYGTKTDWSLVQGDAVFAVNTVEGINNTTKMMSNSDVKQSILVLDAATFEGPFTIEAESYPSFNNAGIIVNYVDNDNFVCVTLNNGDKRVRVRQVVNGIWDGLFDVADGGNGWPEWVDDSFVSEPLDETYLAWSEGKPDLINWKIDVNPDLGTLTIYVDGNLVMENVSVVLPQYTAKVGIWTWWCRHAFDNVKVTKLAEAGFLEDFEETDGAGWEIVKGDPTFQVGNQEVATLNNTSKMMWSSDVKESIVVLKDKTFEGPFTLTFEDYPSFNIGGAIVNYVDNDNFVCVLANNNSKKVSIRQVVGGVWDGQFPAADGEAWRFWEDEDFVTADLSYGEGGLGLMKWTEGGADMINWTILVDPDLGTITVYVDNNLVLENVSVVLPQYNAAVGIYSWWCKRAFDNFAVKPGLHPAVGTKVSKVLADRKLNVYPNPVTAGVVKLDASRMKGMVKVEIIDLSGVVKNSALENSGSTIQLNLGGIAKGLYFLKATDASGVSKVEKLVVR